MVPNLHSSDTWKGLIIGLAVGVVVGMAWGEALRLWTQAYTRKWEMDHTHSRSGSAVQQFVTWIRSLTIESGLLIISAAMMVALGVFQIVNYTRMTGFIVCQAAYNQQSAIARDARINVTDQENNLLFNALRDNITAAHKLESVPPGQRAALQKRLEKQLLNEFHEAVQAHENRLQSAKEHPYPPNPEQTCGNY